MSNQFLSFLRWLQDNPDEAAAPRQLAALNALSPKDRQRFREARPSISLAARRRLAEQLADTAEADVSMDFSAALQEMMADSDEEIRLTALDGLWETEDESLVPLLTRIMESDSSTLVRASAAINLGQFAMCGELEEISPEATSTVRNSLLAAIRSPRQDVEVRRRALESIACMSGDDIAALIRAAYREKDDRMTVSAVYAMGRNLDEEWHPYLTKELKNPRPEIRFEAARAAGELELADAVPTLLEMLYDPEAEVREAAIEALGSIGGERALQALADLAKSDNESIRAAALTALEIAQFNRDPLSPEVISWLFDRDLVDLALKDRLDDEAEPDWMDED